MDRRRFLASLGVAAGAAAAGACGRSTSGQGRAETSVGATDPLSAAQARVAPQAEPTLSVVSANFELLTGADQPFAFGLRDIDNEPIDNADVDVYVMSSDGRQADGPHRASFHTVEGMPLGLYLVDVDLPDAGVIPVVAVTPDTNRAGTLALRVSTPEDSALVAPGAAAPVVATPTVDKPLGFKNVCTATPRCGMHDISLDDALAARRPVMLTFATPAYCQTAVCGPSVEVMDSVRERGEWGDVAWIHVEIYSDDGQTLSKPVAAWDLPTEPWLFAIDADGAVVERRDGPLLVLEDQVAAVADGLA
ncbi:MAG: hypothetical protein M3524_05210 [Actinomycetota bacterium]|nr:hypothetical protein [Actinomycetota bacterium]